MTGAKSWKPRKFHAVFLTFQHPSFGECVIDTGYGPRIRSVSRTLAGWLLSTLLPIPPRQPFDHPHYLQKAHSINAAAVKLVFISHFHADHIGGLSLFPNAQFVYRQESFEALKRCGFIRRLQHSFIPELLPHDILERSIPLGPFMESRETPEFPVVDHFNDGSLLAIDLPGHALGHMGFILRTEAGESMLYAVDAFWDADAWENEWKLPWLSRQVAHDMKAYNESQRRLLVFRERTGIQPIACHCPRTQQYVSAPAN